MSRIFGFEDIAKFGVISADGSLTVSESFKLEKMADADMRCTRVMAYSSYVGEAAPKIDIS